LPKGVLAPPKMTLFATMWLLFRQPLVDQNRPLTHERPGQFALGRR
jgi:hypothetical protein